MDGCLHLTCEVHVDGVASLCRSRYPVLFLAFLIPSSHLQANRKARSGFPAFKPRPPPEALPVDAPLLHQPPVPVVIRNSGLRGLDRASSIGQLAGVVYGGKGYCYQSLSLLPPAGRGEERRDTDVIAISYAPPTTVIFFRFPVQSGNTQVLYTGG
jgi:hypothetical protein